ncbi:hypothetical protein GSI_08458 [Ganoderma sinense ZZ0214-1]|uniref:Uncharacterized protein n=1 Tax=Ganoderma sinense ZZ0214-1 TaxID=1077348 RepID=A0A2G8S3W1_9APHY|nr:hypothetical protein GSI_08458 [Ganoderma sinense ZZ0214-1]
MKLIAPFVLLASLVASSVGQDNFTVSVADYTQCATTVITWENGVANPIPQSPPDRDRVLSPQLAWITHDGASVPVIVTGGLTGTSHSFLNDAEAGYGVEIQVTENNGHNALLQYTIEPSFATQLADNDHYVHNAQVLRYMSSSEPD